MIKSQTSYYQSGQQVTVAQALLRYLRIEGATRLFGIPGGACMHVLDELKKQRDTFHYYICKQETGAAYIADGYSRVTGKLGVVLVTSGPGGTNALTGTMNANASHSSVLTITGEVPEKYFGQGYLQEGADADLDMDNVYRNSVRYSAMVSNPANFATLFTQALREALSIPNRGAHISLPDDIAATAIPNIHFPAKPENYRAVPRGACASQVQRAFELLLQAQRPLILLGNGCRRVLQGARLEMFQSFVDKFAIPVMTTPNGKGVFPEGHALSLRSYGMAGCEWPFYYLQTATQPVQSYDALLVLGSTLGELATNSWNPILIPDGPIIQIDLDQSIIARNFPVELGIVSELGAVIDIFFGLSETATVDRSAVASRRAFIHELKQQHSPFFDPCQRSSEATPIHPARLIKCINEAVPAGSHLFVDAGNCVGWCLNYFEINPPTQLHSALAMGPMGFGVGAVIGAKLGAPERTCLGPRPMAAMV